jgi:hypothetical protein
MSSERSQKQYNACGWETLGFNLQQKTAPAEAGAAI